MPADHDLHLLAALITNQTTFETVEPDQIQTLADLAVMHGLGPMFYYAAKQAAVSENQLQPARQAAHLSAVHEALLSKTLAEVNIALTKAGIPALWLKGAALARTVYPRPYLRSMGDLDVLVPFEQRQEALRIVQELGYQFSDMHALIDSGDAMMEELSHHYHLTGGVGGQVTVELHYQLLGNAKQLLPMDRLAWFWSQTQPITGETTFTILQPETHLLYLCAHALLQHGETDFYLQRFFDIYLLVTQMTLDWALVTTQAEILDWSAAVARGLEIAVQYFGLPVPEPVLAQLQQQGGKNVQRLVMLQGAGDRWEKVSSRLENLSTRDKLRYIHGSLLPPPTFMRYRYNIPEGRWVAPYYLYRWYDQGREMLAWGWRWLALRFGKQQ